MDSSVEAFLARPLQERLGLILARNVRFFTQDGELPLKEGMRLLREMGARKVSPTPEPAPAERLSLAQFLALPVDQKLKIVVEQRVRLHNEYGDEVSFKEALRLIGQA